VLQLIANSKLGKTLVFKGGTALHHCYLDQYRFSEDLDFSTNQVSINIKEVRKIFTDVDYLQIKKDYLSRATIKIEKLQYIGPLVQPNSLKVEIDFLQNVVLPSQKLTYNNVWGINFNVAVMDIREICAEKIRAMSDRARYRDFYDLFLVLDTYDINLKEVVELVKKKEIRQLIAKNKIEKNWQIVLTQKQQEMDQIYYSREVEDSAIKAMIRSLPLVEIV
jgi:predicted nucleotidyltransferase component of viral defense system